MLDANSMVEQALATVVNYADTGRPGKALQMLSIITSINDDPRVEMVKNYVLAPQFGHPGPDISSIYGDLWFGEDLNGKSIEIFSDQGMGDLINLMGYIQLLKKRYDCKIVLNCYSYKSQFERLMTCFDFVDRFTDQHEKCCYRTNLMVLPMIMQAPDKVSYPADFNLLIKTGVPEAPMIHQFFPRNKRCGKPRFGIVWSTNQLNPLSVIKSLEISALEVINDGQSDFVCLSPVDACPSWIEKPTISDLWDTAELIASVDGVITVDTVTLHLAGLMGVPTVGLIAHGGDDRWQTGSSSVWYPAVALQHQSEGEDWRDVLKRAYLLQLDVTNSNRRLK